MTTPTQGEHAQTEALLLAEWLESAAANADMGRKRQASDHRRRAAAELRRLHAQVAALTPAQPADGAAHVQKPAKNEHVAGDVSKNGAESNMGVAYAELPAKIEPCEVRAKLDPTANPDEYALCVGADMWNACIDAAHALRASHGQAPAGAALGELLILLGTKKAWPSYYFNHKDRYECCDCGKEHDDYAEITHAETCDFTQATADRKRIKELVEILKASAPTAQAAPAAAPVRVEKDRLPSWSVGSHMDAISEPAHQPEQEKRVVEVRRTAPAAGAVAGMPPGIGALMCVISSLRDTAHFSDEEGELTDELRTLRDWAMTQAAAPTPAAQADSVLEDAARWNEVLMHVGAANHLGGQHFTLNTLRIRDQMFLLRGSVAQHFTACIDDSRAARNQGANHD